MKKALQNIKVIAFIQGIAGPMTASILASHGAEVIRIETSTRLEWHRHVGPFISNVVSPDRSIGYLYINPGMLGMTLNLKHANIKKMVTRLVVWADVIVENYAGGVMAKLGLGYHDLKQMKPNIIMLSSSSYGQTGPFANFPGYGAPLTALTGLPHLTGFPDQRPTFPNRVLTDFIAPRANVLAIVAALDYRRRTGRGQYIDVAQIETAIPLLTPALIHHEVNDDDLVRMGNRSTYAAPHGVYRCKGNDRWCVITVFTDDDWRKFCEVIGTPHWTQDPEFSTILSRVKHYDRLDRLIEQWTITHTPEEVMLLMQNAGIAAAAVQDFEDQSKDPQLKHRRFYWKMNLPDIGDFTYSGMPAKLSKTPYEMKRAPFLGEHNQYICTELLGMSDEEFSHLKEDGVFE